MKTLAGSNWGFTDETSVLITPGRTWGDRDRKIANGCHQKAAVSHLRAETGVLPQRAHLELFSQHIYASDLYTQSPNRHSPPDSHPLRATLQALYHRILRGLRVRSDDPNAPPLIFGSVLEEGAYLLTRRLLLGQMIKLIVWSQAPNKVAMATPPPIDPAE